MTAGRAGRGWDGGKPGWTVGGRSGGVGRWPRSADPSSSAGVRRPSPERARSARRAWRSGRGGVGAEPWPGRGLGRTVGPGSAAGGAGRPGRAGGRPGWSEAEAVVSGSRVSGAGLGLGGASHRGCRCGFEGRRRLGTRQHERRLRRGRAALGTRVGSAPALTVRQSRQQAGGPRPSTAGRAGRREHREQERPREPARLGGSISRPPPGRAIATRCPGAEGRLALEAGVERGAQGEHVGGGGPGSIPRATSGAR